MYQKQPQCTVSCSMDGTNLMAPILPYAQEVHSDSLGKRHCPFEGHISVVVEESCCSRDSPKLGIKGASVLVLKGLRTHPGVLERHGVGTGKEGVNGGDSAMAGRDQGD